MLAPAVAQQTDVRPLLDRIDRLERDVNMLQRQVYRGTAPGGTPMAVSPADQQSALSGEVRMSRIEDQMRTISGQIEEINYALDQLKRRLDTMASDSDQRFSALEHGGGGAPPPAVVPGPGTRPPASAGAKPPPPPSTAAGNPPVAPPGAGTNPNEPPSRSGVLGTLSSNGDDSAPDQQASPASQAAAAAGTPQEQYNYAFGLLRRADYPGAEQALKGFLQHFPGDALAGNAQYWLGETYYVRKDYENAATAFALGYQKYPKSGKAADNLLKLGMALGNLGKKGEACSAFARLDRDFPTAPASVKEREVGERQQFGCS